MKITKNWLFVPTALTIGLALTTAARGASVLEINLNLQPDPLIVHGTSGGEKNSGCGNIANTPNYIIQVPKPIPYLHLTVKSSGQPTLLVEGPGGRFCVLADQYADGQPQISGFWQAGSYSIYVGNQDQGRHPYTLSISEQRNP